MSPFFEQKKHIVVMKRISTIEKVFTGKKNMESRFSLVKMVPYMQVSRGDILILKLSGGKAFGTVEVSNALYFSGLSAKRIKKIKEKYNSKILADEDYWREKRRARFGTLLFLKNPKRYLAPIKIEKRDRSGWKVIKEN